MRCGRRERGHRGMPQTHSTSGDHQDIRSAVVRLSRDQLVEDPALLDGARGVRSIDEGRLLQQQLEGGDGGGDAFYVELLE